MNVYIEPLIDELLELWKGITMYDITIPCNACMENSRSPGANTFMWYVICYNPL
jgi:hypothetical protein